MKGIYFVFLITAAARAATIAPDTEITIRTGATIHASDADENRIFPATIEHDVRDHDGHLAIPRGSDAELVVRRAPGNELVLDLRAVRVNRTRYILDTDDLVEQGGERHHRTGAYAGGGAIVGGIIGAIAGGGKGAAIGAISGGAAGAGAAIATRGHEVKVPAESVLSFRLEHPVRITEWSDHYDRDVMGPDRDEFDRR
jgi:hypothetical protein